MKTWISLGIAAFFMLASSSVTGIEKKSNRPVNPLYKVNKLSGEKPRAEELRKLIQESYLTCPGHLEKLVISHKKVSKI